MRLYSGKVRPLSQEIVNALVTAKAIETEGREEVVRDLESVFNAFLAADKEVNDRAKHLLDVRNLPQTEFSRVRKAAAEQKGIKTGDEMFDYLLDQCIEMLMHSSNVEEVFAEDHELRRTMRPVLRRYLELDEALDTEVRGKLKHVSEGTSTWEIEYQRVMADIQRRKGLS
ncbi:MAG: DUF507 family protein [Polyangiaceae bacterium]|nr:DUF507 family protein [Polyangiaceae bacterium]MBK8940097.1 DUF507 family protein [Polyangiaceae bacterium]